MYERDTRRDSPSVPIRRSTCEQHGCCYVPKPPDSKSRELECYSQPHTAYSEWVPLPWRECNAQCSDPTDGTVPTQNRRNQCAWTDGRAADAAVCALERPAITQTCNAEQECPACGFLKYDTGEPRDDGGSGTQWHAEACGFGRCERMYRMSDSQYYDETCSCIAGYDKAPGSNRCDTKTACVPAWSEGGWGECVVEAAGSAGTQAQTVDCGCADESECDERRLA